MDILSQLEAKIYLGKRKLFTTDAILDIIIINNTTSNIYTIEDHTKTKIPLPVQTRQEDIVCKAVAIE